MNVQLLKMHALPTGMNRAHVIFIPLWESAEHGSLMDAPDRIPTGSQQSRIVDGSFGPFLFVTGYTYRGEK